MNTPRKRENIMEYTPPPLTAVSRLVIIQPDGPSRDVDSYHASIEVAREVALDLVEGKGWHITAGGYGELFVAGVSPGEMLWDDDGNHVGAVYAYELPEPIIRPPVRY